MDIEAYIEEEQEWLGDWPKEPEDRYGNRQYFTLAKELVENVRNRSICNGTRPADYWKKITEAREIFDDLRTWLNYEDNMTEKQKEEFSEQTFWLHKEIYQGGLLNKKQEVWPIARDELISDTVRYLQTPLMWSDRLDYLLTDALLYAEVSAYRESLLSKERFPEIYGTKLSTGQNL
ncbi:hypothetical protein [Methylohalobius crimeensis]|uniref:hypothetical protein n=1 Tax=Methylohalobius crimeensis TaxID=244365 RepID=UPI0003B4ACB4|nr:hypothetical protein [Methylohalobius crimeensis]